MPGYIGFRPQFNPISLQEYLTVPMMIYEGRQKEADKIEQYQNEAEKWRSLMGDSPEAKAVWANYDSALEALGDDVMANKAGDIARGAKKLSDSYRAIKYKAEDAQARRNRDLERQAKNPNLIGTVGDFMSYYNNADYSTPMFDGNELQKNLDAVSKNIASTLPINRVGYVDPITKHDIIYERGFTPEQKSVLLQDALLTTPQTREGTMLRNALTSSGLDLTNPDIIRQASRFIDAGTRALDINRTTSTNPNFRTIGQQISDESARLDLNQKRENIERYGSDTKPSDAYEDYNVISVDGADWSDPKNKEAASKGLTIIPKGKGYAIIKKYDPSKKKWVAVKNYIDSNGKEHIAETSGQFVISTDTSSTKQSKQYTSVARIYNAKEKEYGTVPISLDDIDRGLLKEIPGYYDDEDKFHSSTSNITYFQDNAGNIYAASKTGIVNNETTSQDNLAY